ncbi:MAG: tRNA pseudouridine(55) synthase TruB [Polyangiaceae bacterium]|nr:tRNA pseudouridine(55) synthase TruB [Polyangiaceae bacterium]MCW5790991.1 tRNA pseudouridine(55) synthase TruB [Polyangiaceae bacterium]
MDPRAAGFGAARHSGARLCYRPRMAHGALLVDKPSGLTSHDVVAAARRVYGTRAVGHAGTLDPMATGLLVLLLGEATKLAGWLTLADKRYAAELRLGAESDTLDADGHITERSPRPPPPTSEALAAAIEAERARSSQIPPQVSAIRVGGRRAHEVARAGGHLDLPARPVRVRSLELTHVENHEIGLVVVASKGYYVRALARDLGAALGSGAYLTRLRRLQSGPLDVEEAVTWPPLGVPPLMTATHIARRCLQTASLTLTGYERARQGKPLDSSCFLTDPPEHPVEPSASAPPIAWLHDGRLVALGRAEALGHTEGASAEARGHAEGSREQPSEIFRVVRGFDPALSGAD